MPIVELREELRNSPLPAQPADKKVFVEGFLVRMCDVMKIDGRNPDAWEVNQILAAIAAIDRGWFLLARGYTEKAMAPAGERAEEWRNPNSDVTRLQLEQAIQDCRYRPARLNGP